MFAEPETKTLRHFQAEGGGLKTGKISGKQLNALKRASVVWNLTQRLKKKVPFSFSSLIWIFIRWASLHPLSSGVSVQGVLISGETRAPRPLTGMDPGLPPPPPPPPQGRGYRSGRSPSARPSAIAEARRDSGGSSVAGGVATVTRARSAPGPTPTRKGCAHWEMDVRGSYAAPIPSFGTSCYRL